MTPTPREPHVPPYQLGDGYVPMSLYLEDRRELRRWLGDVTTDVKAIRHELDREGGRDEIIARTAEAAASRTISEVRSRKARLHQYAQTFLAAALGVGTALLAWWLTHGPH